MARLKPIHVTAHAVRQAHRRRMYPGADSDRVRERITADVTAAILAGRLQNHKPKWALLYRQKQRPLPEGQFAVFTPQRFTWIVQKEETGWIVITSLTPARAA